MSSLGSIFLLTLLTLKTHFVSFAEAASTLLAKNFPSDVEIRDSVTAYQTLLECRLSHTDYSACGSPLASDTNLHLFTGFLHDVVACRVRPEAEVCADSADIEHAMNMIIEWSYVASGITNPNARIGVHLEAREGVPKTEEKAHISDEDGAEMGETAGEWLDAIIKKDYITLVETRTRRFLPMETVGRGRVSDVPNFTQMSLYLMTESHSNRSTAVAPGPTPLPHYAPGTGTIGLSTSVSASPILRHSTKAGSHPSVSVSHIPRHSTIASPYPTTLVQVHHRRPQNESVSGAPFANATLSMSFSPILHHSTLSATPTTLIPHNGTLNGTMHTSSFASPIVHHSTTSALPSSVTQRTTTNVSIHLLPTLPAYRRSESKRDDVPSEKTTRVAEAIATNLNAGETTSTEVLKIIEELTNVKILDAESAATTLAGVISMCMADGVTNATEVIQELEKESVFIDQIGD